MHKYGDASWNNKEQLKKVIKKNVSKIFGDAHWTEPVIAFIFNASWKPCSVRGKNIAESYKS